MALPRIHAVELHELPACPQLFRRIATDYLRTVAAVFRAFEPVTPLLARALTAQGSGRIVDLCSGGSGPVVSLAEAVKKQTGVAPKVVLTDLYPNLPAFRRAAVDASVVVSFEHEPVNALAVPAHLRGVRTIFDAFHHFRPEQARKLLADAAHARAPLLVVEATERKISAMIGMVIFVPLLVLLLSPLIRPFSWGRLLFTYVIPLAVPLILFDGLVSCLRSYTPAELEAMAEGFRADDYPIHVGQLETRAGRLTYLLAGAADTP